MSIQIVEKRYNLYLNRSTPGVVTVDGLQRLRNKIIDAADNTIVGLEPAIPKSLGAAVWTAGGWAFDNTAYIPASAIGAAVQAYSGALSAIAALPGTGLLRKTGASTFAIDTSAYLVSGGALGTPSSGNLKDCTADGVNKVGFRNIPLVSAPANTLVTKAHAGGGLKHPSADTTARTYTIDSNANQSWDDATAITVWNVWGTGGIVTITVTTDPLRFALDGSTGPRTLARGGFATLVWDTASASWGITGAGLS